MKELRREEVIEEAYSATGDLVAPGLRQQAILGYLSQWVVQLEEELRYERAKNYSGHDEGPPIRVHIP